jgi:hypothetical protein
MGREPSIHPRSIVDTPPATHLQTVASQLENSEACCDSAATEPDPNQRMHTTKRSIWEEEHLGSIWEGRPNPQPRTEDQDPQEPETNRVDHHGDEDGVGE